MNSYLNNCHAYIDHKAFKFIVNWNKSIECVCVFKGWNVGNKMGSCSKYSLYAFWFGFCMPLKRVFLSTLGIFTSDVMFILVMRHLIGSWTETNRYIITVEASVQIGCVCAFKEGNVGNHITLNIKTCICCGDLRIGLCTWITVRKSTNVNNKREKWKYPT